MGFGKEITLKAKVTSAKVLVSATKQQHRVLLPFTIFSLPQSKTLHGGSLTSQEEHISSTQDAKKMALEQLINGTKAAFVVPFAIVTEIAEAA